jgi:hypothetical protein
VAILVDIGLVVGINVWKIYSCPLSLIWKILTPRQILQRQKQCSEF